MRGRDGPGGRGEDERAHNGGVAAQDALGLVMGWHDGGLVGAPEMEPEP